MGRKKPSRSTRPESSSMTPSATTDLPLCGSIAVMYRLRATVTSAKPLLAESGILRDTSFRGGEHWMQSPVTNPKGNGGTDGSCG